MTRMRPLRGVRVAVALAVVLVMLVGVGSAHAAHRNQFIRTTQFFEDQTTECASGVFRASGVIEDRGAARLCARRFQQAFVVRGTQQLDGADHYTLFWKVQCGNFQGFTLECKGQWNADGGTYVGGGNVRFLLDFSQGQWGRIDATYTGNLTKTA